MTLDTLHNTAVIGLSVLIYAGGPIRTMGGGCAVSDGSKLPSEDGCMLALIYNQTDDHRLVMIDEKHRRRCYEATLNESKMAPFWEGGKIYVIGHSGNVRGFSIGSDKLVTVKEETMLIPVVRDIEYVRSQDRLYLIRTF